MQRKEALVVLPWRAEEMSAQHRRWLRRSRWQGRARAETLCRALAAAGVTSPPESLGGLRMWGQIGQPPSGWVAAADPVHLEARLDHLALHPLGLPAREVSEIFGYLRNSLADDPVQFVSVNTFGYVRGKPMATASASPQAARGHSPEAFMPASAEAGTHDRLQSEIQMALHEAGFNRRRAQAGMLAVNGLWLWGGGAVQARATPSAPTLPSLFSNDPLFTGYWLSVSAPESGWPGNLDACLEASPAGFVAVVPEAEDGGGDIDEHLSCLRRMLGRGRLQGTTMLFADGLRADRGRWDALRIWRRRATTPKASDSA